MKKVFRNYCDYVNENIIESVIIASVIAFICLFLIDNISKK